MPLLFATATPAPKTVPGTWWVLEQIFLNEEEGNSTRPLSVFPTQMVYNPESLEMILL